MKLIPTLMLIGAVQYVIYCWACLAVQRSFESQSGQGARKDGIL